MATEAKTEPRKTKLYAYLPIAPLAASISKFAEEYIPKECLLKDKQVRTDPIERDSHITVFFGLENKEPSQDLIEACKRLGSITIKLDKLKVFEVRDKVFDDGSKHSFDVLVYDILDDYGKLPILHRLWGDAYGISEEEEAKKDYPYHPHLTIAYLESGRGAPLASVLTIQRCFPESDRSSWWILNKVHVKEFKGSVKYHVPLGSEFMGN
jgi:2'-5' RNA ligase